MSSIEFSGFKGCLQCACISTSMKESAPLMWAYVAAGVNLNVVAAMIINEMVKGLQWLHA